VADSLIRRHLQIATTTPLPGSIGMLDGTQFADRAALLAAANSLSPARSARIAINLLSFEDLSALIDAEFTYCCGAFQRPTKRPQQRQLSTPVAAAAAALAAVIADKPMRELATLFKSDPTISYRLLRTVNSVAFGLSRPAESIHDALILLGSKELYRWLTALLVSSETNRPLAPALYETALTRARLCELIAVERGTEPPEALFVTGAFSLLDVLLDVPLEVPLATARLSETAVEALISGSGPWRPHLDAALAFENADDSALDQVAAKLRLTADRIAELGDAAAAWSHQATAAIRESDISKRSARRAA
jgi:EAL and modified HD-GYP domain-containing signal transduction protein